MAREWLDLTVNTQGKWKSTGPQHLTWTTAVDLDDAAICVHETSRSGMVVLSAADKQLTACGGAAVYLTISFTQDPPKTISAPLQAPIELSHVRRIELSVAVLVGNPASTSVTYDVLVNAHCVYEKIARDCDVMTGTRGVLNPGQSFNETRAVDVTVLGAANRAIESITLKGLNQPASSALVGARVYDSATQALLASGDTIIGPSTGMPVSVPISAKLVGGHGYRVGFFVETNPSQPASATLFFPAAFPYVETAQVFRINSAHAGAGDAFPTGPNVAAPQMLIRARSA